jgi:hypothetical protein
MANQLIPRNYTNTVTTTTVVTGALTTSSTSMIVAAVTNLPTRFPYTMFLDPGNANQEQVDVTAASGTTLTITRDPANPKAHAIGATASHGVSARDFQEFTASQRSPLENYLLGWTMPPEYTTNVPPTAGEVYLQRINIAATGTINYLYFFVVTAGSGMTASQNFVGIFDITGARVAVSADCSSAWTSTHVAKIALVTPLAVTVGDSYYAAGLWNGTTLPQISGGAQQYWDLPNIGSGVSNWASPTPPYNTTAPNRWRYMSWSSSVTAMPSSVVLDNGNPDKAFFIGFGV